MSIKVDNKKLSIALTKVAVDVFDGKFYSAVKGVIDTATAFTKEGPGDPTAEEGARLLLQRGAYMAAMRTIQRFARGAPALTAEADPNEIEAQLSGLAADTSLELTKDAFTDPERWPALAAVLDAFAGWQKACGVTEDKREPMQLAFQEEFALALAGELRDRDREADYRDLLAEVTRSTPLDAAAQRALDWQAYGARLVEAVHRPLRSLDPEKIPRCSLHDLYVPLRASLGELPDPSAARRSDSRRIPILWLDEALDCWTANANRRDSIRVLSGEPGSGKSSACAMLAARLARQGRRVLLVPLSRLNYTGDAATELARFVRNELGHDALERAKGDLGPPLVLILDGLDELAKAGQGAVAILTGFVNNLGFALSEMNRNGMRVLLLLAGRPGAAGSADPIARVEGSRLHVLRYRVESKKLDWFDNRKLAGLDQRPDWWRRFDRERRMPDILSQTNVHLGSLTDQPLLNWLLAQVLVLEGQDKATCIEGMHDLYSRLFSHVLNRFHRKSEEGWTESTDIIPRADLGRMLEEVAVAAWHSGGDRTVPFPVVKSRLEKAGLDRYLVRLTENRDEALTSLLDSFFCRAHAGQMHHSVEFTHKSFGQFLTARRIVREITDAHDDLKGGDRRNRVMSCLENWLSLCGPAAMDSDLLNFLQAEVAAPPREGDGPRDVACWRTTLTQLFQDCVRHGMPMPSGNLRARETERQVRNAEVTLLGALHATVLVSLDPPNRSIIRLDPDNPSEPRLAGATLHRLIGASSESGVAWACLSCLNLAGAELEDASLWGTILTCTNLRGANLTRAILWGTGLEGADLTNAVLAGAKLTGADLSEADLTGARLMGANLTGANLTGANLTNADLSEADLTGIQLAGANLIGANGISQAGSPTDAAPAFNSAAPITDDATV
ncbi:pentapeptide repeat-containing protein [Azospirillum canadense]|uniref:pentapeptide repeat-containing protein n=1 Tax=Azospirillum canadense TaxID=403962 RepID=UPI0022265BDE|nr:pentapeptide repeat-containing protein [Azospirillum canadense]MCW2235611.1 uncharacterized protein YjbI with pentapeptide repeats [Azospirillum canadense]